MAFNTTGKYMALQCVHISVKPQSKGGNQKALTLEIEHCKTEN